MSPPTRCAGGLLTFLHNLLYYITEIQFAPLYVEARISCLKRNERMVQHEPRDFFEEIDCRFSEADDERCGEGNPRRREGVGRPCGNNHLHHEGDEDEQGAPAL